MPLCCQSMASLRYTIPGQASSTSSPPGRQVIRRSAGRTMALEWLRSIRLALT
jgi:hypothetical protein